MKENIKNILLIISIFYSLIIIILMCITTNNLVTTIELNDTEENKTKLKEYKGELLTLEQNDCTKIISDIINHYEKTSYNGELSLKEMYEDDFDNSLLSYYIKARDNCKIDKEKEEEYNLPMKFIASSIQRDEIYQRYYFQYELKFIDYFIRLIAEPQIIGVEYQINRSMELEIIKDLIDISSKEVSVNE